MATLDDLVVPLRVHAPGASLGLLKQAYREAARKFFMETTAWREEVGVTDGSGPGAYTLVPDPTDAEAFDATYVRLRQHELRKRTQSQFKRHYNTGTQPAVFRVGAAGSLFIAPVPGTSVSNDLTILSALRPTRTADEIDDEVVDTFDEHLLNGARWKVLMMPENWGNNSMGEYYRKLFQDAIDYYRSLAADDNQLGVTRKVRYGGL